MTNINLLQGLTNQIESLEDGGIINLVDLIEEEGIEVTSDLLMYLYNNIKHLNIRSYKTINNVTTSIKVYAR